MVFIIYSGGESRQEIYSISGAIKVRGEMEPGKGVYSDSDAHLHRMRKAGSVTSDVRVGVGMTWKMELEHAWRKDLHAEGTASTKFRGGSVFWFISASKFSLKTSK